MGFLLMIHSLFRWVVVIVAIVLVVRFFIGWLRGYQFRNVDNTLSRVFPILVDVQVLLGIIYLVLSGLEGAGFPRVHLEHGFIMIIAAIIGHLPMRWKSAPSPLRYRNTLFSVIASLVVIFVGVAMLPGGWSR